MFGSSRVGPGDIRDRINKALREKQRISESISKYEREINKLKSNNDKMRDDIKRSHLLLIKETNNIKIQETKESFLSSEKDQFDEKCNALDVTKELLEKDLAKHLSSMASSSYVFDSFYNHFNVTLDRQVSLIRTYDEAILEDVKLKRDSLMQDVSNFENEKKQLIEEVCKYEEKWKQLDPSMTEVDVRRKVKSVVEKSNRKLRNELTILDYKRRENQFL
uniref:SWI5-dependent HO expression protein 3 n=1 Tax=Strongyloides papillosus TaxID=174720 RepID=A0A0N5BAB8_STREA